MIKLISSNYDEKDGTSEVIIATEIGNFYGYAFLHPDDENVASSFLGCEIAEYRATISYFKEVLKRVNISLNTLYELQYALNDFTPLVINKRITQKEQYKKELQDNIKSLQEVIDNKVENRLLIIKKLEEVKEKKEDK